VTELLLKLLDLALGGAIERWRRHSALKHEFDVLRRGVLYCGITNDLPVKLHNLRQFMIEHDLVESPQICRDFFEKWLMHPMVIQGTRVLGSFTHDEMRQIERELRLLEP
jgi:hypothetical protein